MPNSEMQVVSRMIRLLNRCEICCVALVNFKVVKFQEDRNGSDELVRSPNLNQDDKRLPVRD